MTLEEELREGGRFGDGCTCVNCRGADRIRALEAELADVTADYERWHQAYCDAKYPESVPLSWKQTAAALKVAEAYAARNALRVIEVEAALRKYGRHIAKPTCCPQANFWEDERSACTCGLDAILTTAETPPHLRGPIIQAHADSNGVPQTETPSIAHQLKAAGYPSTHRKLANDDSEAETVSKFEEDVERCTNMAHKRFNMFHCVECAVPNRSSVK